MVHGARANNLAGETVRLPLGVLAGVCGVSGSGKSTLMIDTIGRVLAPAKQTTSVAYEPVQPGEHDAIEGAPSRAVIVDQSRTGIHSTSGFLDLAGPLQSLFVGSEDARTLGLGPEAFATSCSACGGHGFLTLDMGFLPDVHVPCETCRGTGFLPEAWQVRVRGASLPEVYGLTVDQAYALFADYPAIGRPLASARELGLGYLVLRQPGYALSGGEAQRLKLARELIKKATPGTLYILDEPSIGQHLEDVQRLNGVLDRIVEAQASVMVVEHHPHVLAACDWLVELGPGGGPQGGRIIARDAGRAGGRIYAYRTLSAGGVMTWAPLLLADPSPCLRRLVLTHLLERTEDDPEVRELEPWCAADPLVASLTASQPADGAWRMGSLAASWGDDPVRITGYALARLGYMGFGPDFPPVRRGADFLFSQQREDGSWPLWTGHLDGARL